MERLQKVIARSGICSRRKAEELILEGKVYVNGELCTTLGTKVSGNDEIEVDGKLLEFEDKVYYVINKPKGCICSSNDDRDRRTVLDYLDIPQRVYTVGRLDYDTSGVLLLTNDGDFCNQMIHPRYHLPKTYVVNLQGTLTQDDIRLLRKGLKTNIGDFQPTKVKVISNDVTRDRTIFELTIMEGKNHQVKNMMEALGHQVRKLHRVRFGSIEVNDLKMHFMLKSGLFSKPKVLKAVDGVTFSIEKGRTMGLVGESGCGKTTVGRTILKLYQATAGRILYQGTDITGLSDSQMVPYRKKMQMIFQDPYTSLDPRKNIGDIIAEPIWAMKLHTGKDKNDRVRELIEMVGLKPDHINRYPHEFSGGQRQRIGIARAWLRSRIYCLR